MYHPYFLTDLVAVWYLDVNIMLMKNMSYKIIHSVKPILYIIHSKLFNMAALVTNIKEI